MMGYKICLYGEIWLIIPKLSLSSLLTWSSVQYWLFQLGSKEHFGR